MAAVTLPEVQAWLETTKMQLDAFDPELEATARTMVFGKVGATYDTTGWTDETDTPKLVRSIIAMYVAAWTYNRQYSEEDPDGSGYAKWLIGMADQALEGVASGNVNLPEVPAGAEPVSAPSFYPDDTTGSLYPEEAARFTIGKVF
jgi:hypothetical protein